VGLLLASKLIAAGRGLAPALVRRAATVELDWDTRQKSRFEATDSGGRRIAVFLARGRIVRGGDVLVAEDGSLIAIKAAPQAILAVTVGSGGSPLDLLRAAYHLGNRHVPLEVRGDRLQLEPDHVLAELLGRMGLQIEATSGPFEPEAGAYDTVSSGHGHAHAGETAHGRHHDHDHDHGHGHGHDHDHDHDHGHGHGHADHDHGHGPHKP
jgi:urease accessory protein